MKWIHQGVARLIEILSNMATLNVLISEAVIPVKKKPPNINLPPIQIDVLSTNIKALILQGEKIMHSHALK